MSDSVMEVHYMCAQCGAEDTGRYFVGEPIDHVSPTINCWKCGAGRGLSMADGMKNRRGMFVCEVATQ